MRNTTSRIYIGEVLDLYKLASGNHYGSVKTVQGIEELKFLSLKVYLPLLTVIFFPFYLKLLIFIIQ
jgi:hypothetical protein